MGFQELRRSPGTGHARRGPRCRCGPFRQGPALPAHGARPRSAARQHGGALASSSLRLRIAASFLLPTLLALACRGGQARDWQSLKAEIRARFPEVCRVSTAELAAWLGDSGRPQPLLLDARAPEEYRVSHLPGARLAPDRKTALALLEGLPADTPIVVYCSVGYRSARLADKLRRAGYSRACNLEGSIFQWANEDRPLAGPDGPTRLVHPFNPDWGTLLERDRWAPLGER